MNGIVPMPNIQTEVCLGGHAIVCVGYNETQWIMRNSWGIGWGDKGYFYLPYQYLLDSTLSSDLWDITKIKNHLYSDNNVTKNRYTNFFINDTKQFFKYNLFSMF